MGMVNTVFLWCVYVYVIYMLRSVEGAEPNINNRHSENTIHCDNTTGIGSISFCSPRFLYVPIPHCHTRNAWVSINISILMLCVIYQMVQKCLWKVKAFKWKASHTNTDVSLLTTLTSWLWVSFSCVFSHVKDKNLHRSETNIMLFCWSICQACYYHLMFLYTYIYTVGCSGKLKHVCPSPSAEVKLHLCCGHEMEALLGSKLLNKCSASQFEYKEQQQIKTKTCTLAK